MLQYLIKFSISLAVLFVFYRVVLRPLTFYQCNRFYLLCYSLLSFVIPFIDITLWVPGSNNHPLINIIPAISNYNMGANIQAAAQLSLLQRLTITDWLLIVFCSGAVVMLVRLSLQYLSLRSIRRKAILLDTDAGVQLYETSSMVSPFSFGNAIYFNRQLHTQDELQRIIQHEFVHVKQKHIIDLLTGELLCVVNWFNPFAWFIRYSIRQNLEFIADNNVVANGLDKKEYQYLLLKVVGVPQYSIANNFNFSNLKKRIAMMNKMKSAQLHLTKFLFVLPLLAVMLLAFRNKINYESTATDKKIRIAGMVVDVITLQPIANAAVFCKEKKVTALTDEKGYYFLQLPYENKPLQFTLQVTKDGYGSYKSTENWGNFYHEQVRTRYSNSVELFGLGKGLKDGNGFSSLAGNTIAKEDLDYAFVLSKLNKFKEGMNGSKTNWNDTVPAPPPVITNETMVYNHAVTQINKKGYIITIADNNGECVVLVKDKTQKIIKAITLTDWNKNKKENETAYGQILPPPPPPAPPVAVEPGELAEPTEAAEMPGAPVKPVSSKLPTGVKGIIMHRADNSKAGTNINTVTVTLKNGNVEVYNLNDPQEKAGYIEKYGELPETEKPAKIEKPVPSASPVQIRAVNSVVQPLYIVDGVEKPDIVNANSVQADKIKSVRILKDKMATDRYGDKGKNGVVEINTVVPVTIVDSVVQPSVYDIKNFDPVKLESVKSIKDKATADKFRELLIIVDGKELPAGSGMDGIDPAGIKSLNVLKDSAAYLKYGDKGKKGAIEIETKKAVPHL